MFTDVSVNRDLNDKFRAWLPRHRVVLPLDCSVLVLATGSWPLAPIPTDLLLPGELDACVTAFYTFYKEHFSGRKLQWLHHVSRSEVVFTPRPRVRYTLTQANTFHLAVLLQFNTDAERSFLQLQQATSLTKPVLQATVQSLVRIKLLNETAPTAGAAAGADPSATVYSVNTDFKRYLYSSWPLLLLLLLFLYVREHVLMYFCLFVCVSAARKFVCRCRQSRSKRNPKTSRCPRMYRTTANCKFR